MLEKGAAPNRVGVVALRQPKNIDQSHARGLSCPERIMVHAPGLRLLKIADSEQDF